MPEGILRVVFRPRPLFHGNQLPREFTVLLVWDMFTVVLPGTGFGFYGTQQDVWYGI